MFGRAFGLVSMLALCLIGAGPAARLPTFDYLWREHRLAIGRLPATWATWSGSVSIAGTTARYQYFADRNGKYRRVIDLPLAPVAEGDDGTTFWSQDQNGNVDLGPSSRRLPMEARLLRLNDSLLARGASGTVAGTSTIDGRDVYVVHLDGAAKDAAFYVDERTWLVVGADIGPRSTRYTTYARFDSIVVPTTIVDSDGAHTQTTTVDAVQFAPKNEPSYAAPPQREPVFPAGTSDLVTPFDSFRHLIEVRATINRQPVRFLVDSGSSSSLIDIESARRLSLPTGGVASVEAAGMLTGTLARADEFDLNGIVFKNFIMQAVPLRLPQALAGRGIDGILGYDLFAPLVVRIAYAQGQMRLIQPKKFSYGGTGTIVSLDLHERVPRVAAVVGSSEAGIFGIDTGSDASLVVYKQYADDHQKHFVPTFVLSPESSSGAGGQFRTRNATLDDLTIGEFAMYDVPTEIVVTPVGAFAPTHHDGLIGGAALSKFRAVFLDYSNKRMILER